MTIKQLFEQLLDQVDPDKTITEEKKSDLIQMFEGKISEVKEKAFEDALETIDEDHAEKLQRVVTMMESMDEDHATKLEQIIESIDTDHTAKLEQVIEAIDEDHTSKMKEIIEGIDQSHADKLEQVLEQVDKDHTAKLEQVIEMYENKQNEDITDQISDYLDMYLESVKPEEAMIKEARLNKLEQTFEQLREVLVVNDEKVQSEVTEAILDAHQIIEEKDKEINRLMLEKVEMNQAIKLNEAKIDERVQALEAQHLLEEKMNGSSPKLRNYLELCFDGATKEEIEEKFDEAVMAFKTTEEEKRQAIIESHQDRDDDRVIPESIKTEERFEDISSESQMMNTYAAVTNKTVRRMK